jgi:hypothetical protein
MKDAPKKIRQVNNNSLIFNIETMFGKISSKKQDDGSYTIYFEKNSSQDGFYEATWNQVKEEHLPFIKDLINKQKRNPNLQNVSGFRFQKDLDESYFNEINNKMQFFIKSIDPTIWLLFSEIHKTAALQIYNSFTNAVREDLYEESLILGQYYLLMGFSIENLLKAILISHKFYEIRDSFEKSHDYKEAESFLEKNLSKCKHNLEKIAEKVIVKNLLTKEEHDFLRRLKLSIEYSSKYPVPFKMNVYGEHKNYTPYSYCNSKKIIDSLYFKLTSEYKKNLKLIKKDLDQLISEAWKCAF